MRWFLNVFVNIERTPVGRSALRTNLLGYEGERDLMNSQAVSRFSKCERLLFPTGDGVQSREYLEGKDGFLSKTFELTKFSFSDQTLSCF